MKTFTILLFCLVSTASYAQIDTASYLNNFHYTVSWSQESVVNGDTVVRLRCNVNVPDTNSLSAIAVKVGAFKGDGSLVNYTFPLSQSFAFPNDYSLQLNGNSIQIDLGRQSPRLYYVSLVLYDSFGKKSNPLFYNSTTNKLTTH